MEEVGDLGREGGGQRRSVAGEENLEGETFSCLIQIIFSLSLPALSLCLPLVDLHVQKVGQRGESNEPGRRKVCFYLPPTPGQTKQPSN